MNCRLFLDIQDELQTLYTSGTVFHTFLGEKLPDWKAAAALVRKIAENYRLPYYTISPTYSICRDHGYLSGEQYKCPYCGRETEVYSRITGYYRPVKNWNDGKTQEFKERKVYALSHSRMIAGTPEAEKEEESMFSGDGTRTMLFTTKTCPNCSVAAGSLDDAAIPYEVIDAEEKHGTGDEVRGDAGSDFGHRKRREGNETGKCIKYQGVCRKTAEK